MPLRRDGKISLVSATAIVVANMIGTGVFTTLGFQLLGLKLPLGILLLWFVGGCASLCGALAYGALAERFPRSGGEYYYLSRLYHPAVGFAAGWVSMTVGFAAPIALAAMAFGKYAGGALGLHLELALSLGVVLVVTLFHCRGVGLGAAFQNAFTAMKFLLACAVAALGFSLGQQEPDFGWSAAVGTEMFSSSFAVGLVYVMYAYSGWNAAVYIANEVENPRRTVPMALAVGCSIVAVVYIALNASFLLAAPRDALAGEVEVGLIAGQALLGEKGGAIIGGLIALGLVSAISAMVWTGSRVIATMGEDYRILSWLGWRDAGGTPLAGLAFVAVLVAVLIVSSSFERVLIFAQFILMLCSFLCVWKVALTSGSYSGYQVVAAWIFLVIIGWMMILAVSQRPAESIAGSVLVAAGAVVYFLEPAENRRALARRMEAP